VYIEYTSHIGLDDNTAKYTISISDPVDEIIQEESISDIIPQLAV